MDTRALEVSLLNAKSLCVFTGAGVSQESGIPTFRGENGLWKQFRAEDLATPEAFERNPQLVWEWYAWRRELIHNAQPNAAHRALAQIESALSMKSDGRFTLITQNVDGLHQRAGSQNIILLHGDIWVLRCSACDFQRRDESVPLHPLPPICPACRSLLRPGVVWFGEPLPSADWTDATHAAEAADVFLVIGTSALVYPAAHLPQLAKQHGAQLIEINPERTALSSLADLFIQGKAAEAFASIQIHIE
ncbi:MAG: NAD-dependent protein deacylase [Acidobacteria bacterium RIFCSPLOWO2_12_FULL_54_10]|nr:MAG: NAD-dependent protein deacylase [Acidobacteria bacterium RIFCSPLOWO2_12_FULL_54_10]